MVKNSFSLNSTLLESFCEGVTKFYSLSLSLIKSEIIKNIKDRISMTKLPIIPTIEEGRHRNIYKTLRICPFCTSKENHSLTKYETFRYIRADLL